MTDLKETIREIRVQLRRSMNGVVATSMRRQGVLYKLNFGVSLLRLKEIAQSYPPGKELAEALWSEDIREFKILATLLYPVEQFTRETADRWVRDIRYQEIAEQYSHNLLKRHPQALAMATDWVGEEGFVGVMGYLLFARLFEQQVVPPELDVFFDQAVQDAVSDDFPTQRATVVALKRFGRISEECARLVMQKLAPCNASGDPVEAALYEDIKIEFDYYYLRTGMLNN